MMEEENVNFGGCCLKNKKINPGRDSRRMYVMEDESSS